VGTVVCPRRDWNLLDEDVLRWEYESGPGPDFLRNLVEVRQTIEPAAAQLAALRATPEERAAIQAAYAALAESVDDPAAYIQTDMDFHAAIFSSCHNELLEQLARTISMALRASRKTTVQIPHGARETLPIHKDVMQAIVQHDPEGAYAAMSRIIARAAADIERVLSALAQPNP
jgi:DNA-binding FadR family transcriptional regulator